MGKCRFCSYTSHFYSVLKVSKEVLICCFVWQGALRDFDVSDKVSKGVWCDRPNTLEMVSGSEDDMHFSWQAKHFGRVHVHFAWQWQHIRRVVLPVLCESRCQGCVKL